MKKALVCLAVLGILGTGAVVQAAVERGYISVNTSANTEIAPDVAEISFAVQTNDNKSMQNATKANKEISDKVFAQLKSMINTQNGDYIKTSDFNASPIYNYVNSKRVFEKYQVSNRVIVHTKSIENVGKMIDSAITAGATNVDNLTFSVSSYDKQCNDLITIAADKARTRAGIIAKATGSNLDGIRTFDTSCSTNNYNNQRFYMAKNMMADVAETASSMAGGISISDGVIKINANVNATYFVK